MDGDGIGRGLQDGGHWGTGGGMLVGTSYICYQSALAELLADCFRMSFQSGAVFCNSQVIRGFPCQDIEKWTLELEFRVYHNM